MFLGGNRLVNFSQTWHLRMWFLIVRHGLKLVGAEAGLPPAQWGGDPVAGVARAVLRLVQHDHRRAAPQGLLQRLSGHGFVSPVPDLRMACFLFVSVPQWKPGVSPFWTIYVSVPQWKPWALPFWTIYVSVPQGKPRASPFWTVSCCSNLSV